MIVLDADVVLTDYRYQRDVKFPVTRQVLDRIRASGETLGITTQALLEIVGVLSFNVASRLVESLPEAIQTQYQLTIIPGLLAAPDDAGCSVNEILYQMRERWVWAMPYSRHNSASSPRPIRHSSPGTRNTSGARLPSRC